MVAPAFGPRKLAGWMLSGGVGGLPTGIKALIGRIEPVFRLHRVGFGMGLQPGNHRLLGMVIRQADRHRVLG